MFQPFSWKKSMICSIQDNFKELIFSSVFFICYLKMGLIINSKITSKKEGKRTWLLGQIFEILMQEMLRNEHV
jgi:hypothetical protein